MTKFLNESGFRRIIKTIKNALSLKADKSELPLLVTYNGTQCDTSIADIYAAFLAGRDVEMNYGYMFKLSLVQCSEEGAIFSANFGGQSIGIKGTISNGVDTWEFIVVDLQERLTSGTNIKTVNHESVLGSGNVNLNGSNIDTAISDPNGDWVAGESIDDILAVKSQALADLEDKVDTGLNKRPIIVDYYHYADMIADSSQRGGTIAWEGDNECFYIYETANGEWRRIDNEELNQITSITTTESTASGGNNTVTINTTDGTSKTFNVKNGTDGKDGQDGADGVSLGEIALVQTTGDSEQSVMSQKAVTEYGRKVTAEDLNGTSEWIRAKLTAEGWEFEKYVASNGSLGTDANFCASFFIPMDMSTRKGHSITFGYMFNAWNGTNFAWYNGSKTFVSGLYYYCNENNARTIIISASNTWDNAAYIRMTCNPNRLNECYILDNTTGEYIFKGDEYLVPYNNNNITYGLLENSVIAQELGDSTTKVVSQKAITDAINYNTSIENAEGFTLNSKDNNRFLVLTPKATALLNASDKMTFMFSTKGTGNLADYRYFKFGNGSITANNFDSNGAYISYSYSRNLSANQVSYTLNKKGDTNVYPTPDVWIVTWDRVNGIVRFYDHTTLVNTLSSDSYKKERFVNDEGKIAIMGGNNNTRIYDIRLFDYDISYLFGNSDISSEINNLCGAGILPSQFLNNYNHSDGSFITETNNFGGGGYTATCTFSLDGDDYHIVVKDGVSTTQICGGKPYYLGMSDKAQLERIEFEVVSGVIKHCWRNNALEENLNYRIIIDSNGNEISDYDNIGVGKYTLIKTQSNIGGRFNFYKVSGDVEVVINRNMKYKPISCVFHLRGDTMYNKKFYDDQTNSFITLYTDRTCSVEYMEHTLVKTPQRVIRTEISSLNGLPHYAGEMAVVGNNVYIGMSDYTWKQINNS